MGFKNKKRIELATFLLGFTEFEMLENCAHTQLHRVITDLEGQQADRCKPKQRAALAAALRGAYLSPKLPSVKGKQGAGRRVGEGGEEECQVSL